jgi:glycosyltransferase involved in cell wall biosynthesis
MTGRLRVLVLNERCHRNPLAGGVELHVFEIFSRLRDEVQAELLCCGFEGAPAHDVHRGVRITRVGRRLSYYARVPGEVRRRIARGEVDLVVEELSKVPYLTPLYAGPVPVLVLHHHLHGLTAFRQVGPAIAAAAVTLEATLPFVYRGTPFLTVSESSRRDLVRRGVREEAIDIVPNGIDHARHRPAPVEGRAPVVISVGRLEPYKHIDLLLRAMPRVLADVPDAKAVIVGRGQSDADLKRLARGLGIVHAVTFTGYVGDREKAALLQQAAVHVQCSRKEGWGLSVFEAYACGTPVVAMRVPGLIDSVQDGITGRLVHKPHPRPLAAAIVRLLTHEDERVELAQRAMTWVATFSWDRMALGTRRAIRAAVSPRVPRIPQPFVPPASVPARVGALR